MRPRFIWMMTFAAALSVAGVGFALSSGSLRIIMSVAGVVLLLSLILLRRSVVKPVDMARNGIDLLSAQDFNNRLVRVGEPGADRIADLFNDLVTRLKNERLRLREQDTFLRLLIEASPMGVALLNLSGKVTVANPAFRNIAGLRSDEDISGMPFSEVGGILAAFLRRIPEGESSTLHIDGMHIYKGYHLTFMQDGFRRHFYLVEPLAEEVREAEKSAYGRVIRMISHEVNNTVGSIQAVLETLSEESEADEGMLRVIDSCRERCTSMTGFISSFAEVVRVPDAEIGKVCLASRIEDMLPFLHVMAGEGIAVETEIAPGAETVTVEADTVLFERVIVNVVKNAVESVRERMEKEEKVKTSSEPGRIVLRLSEENGKAQLEIINNGTAIAEEVSGRLFSPFFSTKKEGRGLGLTLVSEILAKHDCDFSLATRPDGLTAFTIRFR